MSEDAEAAIDVTGLTKRYGGRAVVDDVGLRVARGRICGFLGPNGSGKTTTIRMLCGLLVPDAGTGTCLGHDIVEDAWAIKQQVGYMTQRFSLYEDLTVRENLEFYAGIYEVPRGQLAGRIDELVAMAGLRGREHQLTGQLSGGWKQRLALGCAIVH